MPVLPASLTGFPLIDDGTPLVSVAAKYGWTRIHQGKVRDTYASDECPDRLVVVATDRLSIFDFVLPALVPFKGEVLTMLTNWWLSVAFPSFRHHLIPEYPPEPFPPTRSLVVHRLTMWPYELIFRHHIGGSVWTEYKTHGTAAGERVQPGLARWDKLDFPIFTPSTKAEVGHDENIKAEDFFAQMGSEGAKAVDALRWFYGRAYDIARERQIYILDTKFEAGILAAPDARHEFYLGDEVLTPDSSRFTTTKDLEEALAEGRNPVSYDKQLVRDWGQTVETPFGFTGLDHKELDPAKPEHLVFVHGLEVPQEIIAETSARYQQIFAMLTGDSLAAFQKKWLGR